MIEILRTEEFKSWLETLRDNRVKALIASRLHRLSLGHAGDAKPVGEGVSELRIHYGPGYRIYYVQRDRTLIVLLCGGDKDSQTRDIRLAQELAEGIED